MPGIDRGQFITDNTVYDWRVPPIEPAEVEYSADQLIPLWNSTVFWPMEQRDLVTRVLNELHERRFPSSRKHVGKALVAFHRAEKSPHQLQDMSEQELRLITGINDFGVKVARVLVDVILQLANESGVALAPSEATVTT